MFATPPVRIRRKFLEEEYARAEVPIFEATYQEYVKEWQPAVREFYEKPEHFMGLYVNDRDCEEFDLPARFILINRSMSNYDKLTTLWHELGHHSCVKLKCACARNGFSFRKTELHAELAGIYIAHRRGFERMTLDQITAVVEDFNNDTFHYIHNSHRMVKHRDFQDAVASVEPEFRKWLNAHKPLKDRYEKVMVDKATRPCRWTPSKYLQRVAGVIR